MTPSPRPSQISVALVTRNRPLALERCLASLRAQDAQPYEVLVADDSDAAAAGECERIASRWACRYVVGPRRGLYANRNRAALACQGTHVRTMDDDHEFPVGHMARCLEAVGEDRSAVWVIGEYITPAVAGPPPHPRAGQLHPRGYSVVPAAPEDSWAIADGSSIYPREIFESGVMFVEDFTFGYNFLEFGSRLRWLGYRIRFLDDTYVLHHSVSRSIVDPVGEEASRMFAMLCHSWIYQPTVANRLLTAFELAKTLALEPTVGTAALRRALAVYRMRREGIRHQADTIDPRHPRGGAPCTTRQ